MGWSTAYRAWSFPMSDPAQHVVGIRLRRPDGTKLSVPGGKEGLFIPVGQPTGPAGARLLICEGVTDTAALLDLGFPAVVGRPSCSGGVALIVALVQERRPAEVVLMADADEPGVRGANNLASVLVAYGPAVRVVVVQLT